MSRCYERRDGGEGDTDIEDEFVPVGVRFVVDRVCGPKLLCELLTDQKMNVLYRRTFFTDTHTSNFSSELDVIIV